MRPRDIHATIRTARTAGALYLLIDLFPLRPHWARRR